MDINEMTLLDVNERLSQLEEEVREAQDVETVEKATEEKRSLLERKAELDDLEQRKADALAIENGAQTKIVEERKEMELIMEEKKTFGRESQEYRNAFYAWLRGDVTEEQRAILTTPISVDGDGANDGAAIAIPKTLDDKIWDNIHTEHPILADITTVASGIVMEVTKHVAIANRVSGKKDAAANAGAEENTFVKVTLAGVDYEKYVELTYAEAKMSQGALEDYLAQEIAAELGEALAKDVFAKIDADTTATTKTSDIFADIKTALGATVGATTIYAPSAMYYDIAAYKDNGILVNLANVLGVEVKKDDAATNVTVVNPKMFILNQVSGVLIESDKDIKNHRVVVSGWMRAEGTMRNNKAGSVIK